MAKNEKSQADLYREERKKRIAKASKKKSNGKVGKIIGKIVAVILCIAIIFGIGAYINSLSGFVYHMATAMKVGDSKISATEYAYYYYNMFSSICSNADQYGFDINKSPAEQDFPQADEDGKTYSYAEYIQKTVKTNLQTIYTYYNMAVADNFELPADAKAEMEESLKTYQGYADNNGMTFNAWLNVYFGHGLNEKYFKDILNRSAIASAYQETISENFKKSITDEKVQAEFDKDPTAYQVASVRFRSLKNIDDKKADAILKEIKDDSNFNTVLDKYDKDAEKETATAKDAFVPYESDTTILNYQSKAYITSAIGEEAANWVFKDAKKGKVAKFVNDDKSVTFVLLLTEPAVYNNVTVRYCLVPFNENTTVAQSEEEIKTAKATAEGYLKEFESTGKTEDDFANICKNYSADTSTSEDGGLVSFTRGRMVPGFEKWCFDKARKAGDYELVKCDEYGYFLIYFVSNDKDDFEWKETVKSTLTNDKLEKDSTEAEKNNPIVVSGFNSKVISKTNESVIDKVLYLTRLNSNAQ